MSFYGSSLFVWVTNFEMSTILFVLIIFPDRPKLKLRITKHEFGHQIVYFYSARTRLIVSIIPSVDKAFPGKHWGVWDVRLP
jgi:hypothetical protein